MNYKAPTIFFSRIKKLDDCDVSGIYYTREWADDLLANDFITERLSNNVLFGFSGKDLKFDDGLGLYDMRDASFLCTNLRIFDGWLVGEFEILDTPRGKNLIKAMRKQKRDREGFYNCVAISATGSVICGNPPMIDRDTYSFGHFYFINRQSRKYRRMAEYYKKVNK